MGAINVIGEDATLRSLALTLSDPIEFVRSVLENMTGLYRDCAVRLARSGDAGRPDYQIEMLIYDEDDGEVVVHHQRIATISGKTHRQVADDLRRPWSDASMTFAEVQDLLGELRQVAKS